MKGDLVHRLDYRTVSDMGVDEVLLYQFCLKSHFRWRGVRALANTDVWPLPHAHTQVRPLLQGPRLSSVVLGLIKPKYRLRVNVRLQVSESVLYLSKTGYLA